MAFIQDKLLDNTITGSSGDDLIIWEGGRDFIDGNDGHDVLSINEHTYNYDVTTMNSGITYITAKEGGFYNKDITMINVEVVEFLDTTVKIGTAINTKPDPVVTRGSNYDDYLEGGLGDDELTGLRGKDYLIGYDGNDVLRAGNGRDVITGGNGADDLYGGFGLNTFTSEIDGSEDWLYLKSDQHAYNYVYGKAGNNLGNQKCDNIMGLDSFDLIFIQGVDDSDLSFGWTTHQSGLGTLEGIGIWAGESLEAVYTGGNLSVDQVIDMTWGAAA